MHESANATTSGKCILWRSLYMYTFVHTHVWMQWYVLKCVFGCAIRMDTLTCRPRLQINDQTFISHQQPNTPWILRLSGNIISCVFFCCKIRKRRPTKNANILTATRKDSFDEHWLGLTYYSPDRPLLHFPKL